MSNFALWCFEGRTRIGLSQAALAERLGASTTTISRYENGHDLPKLKRLVQMCCLFESTFTVYGDSHGET